MYFTRSAGAVSVTGIEKVKKLTVRVVVQDCTGTAPHGKSEAKRS